MFVILKGISVFTNANKNNLEMISFEKRVEKTEDFGKRTVGIDKYASIDILKKEEVFSFPKR